MHRDSTHAIEEPSNGLHLLSSFMRRVGRLGDPTKFTQPRKKLPRYDRESEGGQRGRLVVYPLRRSALLVVIAKQVFQKKIGVRYWVLAVTNRISVKKQKKGKWCHTHL